MHPLVYMKPNSSYEKDTFLGQDDVHLISVKSKSSNHEIPCLFLRKPPDPASGS